MGDPGLWGLRYLWSGIPRDYETALLASYLGAFKPLILLGSFLIGWLLVQSRKQSFLQGVFAVFALFLVLTPGFGVQYLSWLSFFAIMVFPTLGTFYTLIGGAFLWSVYSHWGALTPPYYANAPLVGSWGEIATGLGLVTWLVIISMLVHFLLPKIYYQFGKQ